MCVCVCVCLKDTRSFRLSLHSGIFLLQAALPLIPGMQSQQQQQRCEHRDNARCNLPYSEERDEA
jgi:hypothetical protein